MVALSAGQIHGSFSVKISSWNRNLLVVKKVILSAFPKQLVRSSQQHLQTCFEVGLLINEHNLESDKVSLETVVWGDDDVE